jgi:hypothetical protein
VPNRTGLGGHATATHRRQYVKLVEQANLFK